ncbi:MAG: hypothetical protein JWN76_1318 [Chitinophagaceae bacterium]|nr:hypothetical protein [Chitinophagaceae bacterium]
MPGSLITFQLDNHQWLQGIIKKIAKDSIFIREVKINPVYGQWGFAGYDTGILDILRFHIKDLVAFPAKEKSFSFISNGMLFQLGSASYITLNIINGLARKENIFDKKNSVRLGIAALVFGIGEYLHLSHPADIRLGKKYRLLYIRATG